MSKRPVIPGTALRTLCIKEQVHIFVLQLASSQWSHVAKMAGRLLFVTISTKSLITFMFRISCYQITTISAYLFPLADQLAFHFENQLILKTFLTEKVPVAFTTILGLIFSTGWCSITKGANFVTFMCFVIESVTRITYVPFRHSSLDVGNYIVVPTV